MSDTFNKYFLFLIKLLVTIIEQNSMLLNLNVPGCPGA